MSAERVSRVSSRDVIASFDRNPVFAADGGILLKISDLRAVDPLLRTFLLDRTMQTGKHFARRKDQPRGTSLMTFTPRDAWRTAMGAGYYEPNFENGKDTRSIETRQAILVDKIAQDKTLVDQWPRIQQNLSRLDKKTRVRVERAVLQNLANDAAAVDYAFQVANLYGAGGETAFPNFTDKAVDVVAMHYGHIVDPPDEIDKNKLREFFTVAGNALEQVGSYLRKNEPDLDYIRTRRETDSIKTLSAAKTFLEEFRNSEVPSTVVVPLFGAYDIAAALQVAGFTGKIAFVLAHEKRIKQDGIFERTTQVRNISNDRIVKTIRLASSENPQELALFEDSIGKAEHTIGTETVLGLIPQLLQTGARIIATRFVVDGRFWYPTVQAKLDKIGKMTRGSVRSYGPQELEGGPNNRAAPDRSTKQRKTHTEWVLLPANTQQAA